MKTKYIIYVFLCAILFGSCEDVLETKTTLEWEDTDVWRIPDMAQGVLMNAYAAIPIRPDNYGNNFLDCATDNALTTSYESNVYKAGMGGITAFANPLGNWANAYSQLQHINIFLEKGLADNVLYNRSDLLTDSIIKSRLKGEAHFLRAWWHHELLKVYGGKAVNGKALGIPLAKKYYTQEETSVFENFERASYDASVAFIISDLDTAMTLLPNAYTGTDVNLGTTHIGRANKMAAAVLKARVYLYAASPAYQDDDIIQINGMGDFTVLNETEYQRKWELVALKMDTIIQMTNFGVFTALTSVNLVDATNATPSDFVFRKFFNTNALEMQHFPPFYQGNANTIPSHNLVKAFNTKSGFPQNDPRSGWTISAPYNNLDNRFLMNIYHHGRVFGAAGGAIDVVKGGKDSPEYDQRASRSGYYLAKFISTKNTMLNPTLTTNSIHYNPLLRRSEVFLDFAEASNEAWGPKVKGPGCKYSAYDIIKEVRSKSGGITSTTYLDEMALSKDDFRKLIQNERRIEFAFENHRYFDLRRCLLPLNEDVYGIEVTVENGLPVYAERKLEARSYEVKHYFSPLPYEELIKNKHLINNKGWE